MIWIHAFRIKELLKSLVELADEEDEKIADGTARPACFEVPSNLLKMVLDSISQLPESVLERLPEPNDIQSCIVCEDATENTDTERVLWTTH